MSRESLRTLLAVLAGVLCALALYHGVVPRSTNGGASCGMPVRDLANPDADVDCRDVGLEGAATALQWLLLAVPATLAYAVVSRRDGGDGGA